VLTNPFIVPTCHENIEILYQDEDLLMANKPTTLLSVPGRHPANRDCLISRIQQSKPEARIVHRLDMDTSGVMVVALTTHSHRELNRQFAQREVSKRYEAVVFGLVDKDRGSIDAPLCSDWPNRPKQKIDPENGKTALTHYEVLSRNEQVGQTRLSLTPVTGRSHQLRIHLAHLGHPILGCSFYAHELAFEQSTRLLLHATYLSVTHPVSGECIEQYSPVTF
jgi:tRNA pseudouridine32 synthase / 23S rRNA pseudouridine746 synthase